MDDVLQRIRVSRHLFW